MAAAADEVPEFAPELTVEEQELVQGLQDCIHRARHRANKHWPPDVAQEMVQALLSKAKVGSFLVCTVGGCRTAWVVPVRGPSRTGLLSNVKVNLLTHLCISGLQDCICHASQIHTKHWLANVAQCRRCSWGSLGRGVRSGPAYLFVWGLRQARSQHSHYIGKAASEAARKMQQALVDKVKGGGFTGMHRLQNLSAGLGMGEYVVCFVLPAKTSLPSALPCSHLDCALPLLQSRTVQERVAVTAAALLFACT